MPSASPPIASEEFSDSVAKGLVISSSPKSGTSVQVGFKMSIRRVEGPPPVTVPSVVAMDRNSAVAKPQSLGLKVSVRNQLPVVVVGRVYSQSPSPGSVVPRGSTRSSSRCYRAATSGCSSGIIAECHCDAACTKMSVVGPTQSGH